MSSRNYAVLIIQGFFEKSSQSIKFIMSAIKYSPNQFDHIYQTPLKYHAKLFSTNPSLALSSTLAYSRPITLEDQPEGWKSSELLQSFPSADITTIRGQQLERKTSELSFNRVINASDIHQLLGMKRMVEQRKFESLDQTHIIMIKKASIKRLKEQIYFYQKALLTHKNKYRKLKENFEALKKNLMQRERAKSQAWKKSIRNLEVEIRQMRRTLSNKKNGIHIKEESDSPRKHKPKQKIYVPISQYPMPYHYNPLPPLQQNLPVMNTHNVTRQTIYSQATQYHKGNNKQEKIQENSKSKFTKDHKMVISIPPPEMPKFNNKERRYSQGQPQESSNIMTILQSKLETGGIPLLAASKQSQGLINTRDVAQAEKQMERERRNSTPNVNDSNPLKIISQHLSRVNLAELSAQNNKGCLFQERVAEFEKEEAVEGEYHIEVHKANQKRKNEMLDQDENFKGLVADEISKKNEPNNTSIQANDPPSEGQEEVRKTLKVIEQTIRKSEDIIPHNPINKEYDILKSSTQQLNINNLVPKSDIQAKLVQSVIKDSSLLALPQKSIVKDSSFDGLGSPEKSDVKDSYFDDVALPQHSKSKEVNRSDINISIDSQEKKSSKLDESGEKKPLKDSIIKLTPIAQSSVNIIMLDSLNTSNSPRQGSEQGTSKYEPSPKLQRQIFEIAEVEDEDVLSRQNTPLDSKLEGNFELLMSSKLSHSRRDSDLSNKGQRSNPGTPKTPKTPVLSNPPSLIQKEGASKQQDDFLNSINLSPHSRRMQKPILRSSNANHLPPSKEEDQDDDDIFSINLVTESRISRDKKSQLKNMEAVDSLDSQLMTRSDPAELFKRHSLPDHHDDDAQQIRKSTTSTIVRKGSAIQKVKDRAAVNNIKVSNYGSPPIKGSNWSSTPIEEAEEAEEELQNTDNEVSKHKKHQSSVK